MPIIQHSFVWVLVASIPRHPCNASLGGNSGSVGYAAFPHMWSRQQRIWRNPAGGGGWRRRVRRWRSGGGAVGGSTAGEEVNTSEEQGGAERRCRGKVRVVGWRTGDERVVYGWYGCVSPGLVSQPLLLHINICRVFAIPSMELKMWQWQVIAY